MSKAVGGSVVRHRVARRLRATMRAQLDSVPAGTDVVVRALPAASTATSAQLSEDIAGVLRKLSRP